jgi:Phage Tail Collar Domain
MPSTYSTDLRIELIANGEQSGTWGSTTNSNLGTIIEDAISGLASVSVTSANQALTALNGAADEARCAAVSLTTTTTAAFAVYVPPVTKLYVVKNASAYAATVYCSTVIGNTTAAGTGVAIPAGKSALLRADGTNVVEQFDYVVGNFGVGGNATITGNASITGTTTLLDDLILNSSSGTAGQVVVSQGAGSAPVWGNSFVTGMIMMWSGSIASIPSGWVLCNGSSGTPDLRDRFVVGAGSTYAVGATGGSANAIVVSHTHTGTTGAMNSNATHSHTYDGTNVPGGSGVASRQGVINTKTTSTANIDHTHSFTTDATGSSATNANLPPYYALAYIMKL